MTVLIIDEDDLFIAQVERLLAERCHSAEAARTFTEARSVLAAHRSTHVVSELRVGGQSLMDFAADPAVTAIVPPHRFIVLTAYPSVATAVAVIRQGMGDYLPRPASSEALHAALIGDEPEVVLAAPTKWPSLDRTIWEYINQVWMSAGSLSEAARRLRVDRRSLRRMLAKHPPPQ